MRVTREQAAANRDRIIEAAGALFRKHGFDGVGVDDITRAAGLTHGGFYGHFKSKDDLAAEACARGSVDPWAVWKDKPPAERLEGRPARGCIPFAGHLRYAGRDEQGSSSRSSNNGPIRLVQSAFRRPRG